MTTGTRLVIGIDGGQTSTRTLLADTTGRILGRHTTGPSNHVHEPGGLERQFRALHDGYLGAFRAAGLSPQAVACAVLGLSGSGDLSTAQRAVPAERLILSGDTGTAFAGALPDLIGIIVIAGTGSIAYGCDPSGRCAQVGGWGYFAGDEGSAYDIARHAVRAAFQAYDGRLTATPLTGALVRHFGVEDLEQLHRHLYSGRLERDELAAAAAVVGSVAEDGDPTALGIIQDAASELARLITAIIHRLDFGHLAVPIALIGGVFRAGEVLKGPLVKVLRDSGVRADLVKPRLDPARGAVLLALQELSVVLDQNIIENLQAAD